MPIYHLQAAALLDASGYRTHPGGMSILVELTDPIAAESADPLAGTPPIALRGRLRIIASGTTAELAGHPAMVAARAIARPRAVLMPGLINAHTHLDLTHIGPQPHDPARGFAAWGDFIRRSRVTDPGGIAQSVARGVALSLRGGTVAVGDIAGTVGPYPKLDAFEALAASPLVGVSYAEYFAISPASTASLAARLGPVMDRVRAGSGVAGAGVRLGLQPHAPYSVSPAGYEFARAALGAGVPVSTHLAETAEEHEFVAKGTGPLREFLWGLGLWSDELLETYGHGQTPVELLCSRGARQWPGLLAAHVNDASDRDIELLALAGVAVAYCPRASDYFGAPGVFGPHRYADMLSAGVRVCLGTDSVVNLPEADVRARGMSMVDELGLLYQRDGGRLPLADLVAMASTTPAGVLGLDVAGFTLDAGPIAGILAVEPGHDERLAGEIQTNNILESVFSATASPVTTLLALHASERTYNCGNIAKI